MAFPRWSWAPPGTNPTQARNYRNVQLDGLGIGFSDTAVRFLPILLVRLGATSLQVGLLTAMPAVTGMVLSVFIGQYLQTRPNIVPWLSVTRCLTILAYGLTSLAIWLLPAPQQVTGILVIWGLITVPQVIVAVAFAVVMNAVAGPQGRYTLMSRRWSLLNGMAALSAVLVGQFLQRGVFPLNYQAAFLVLASGGLFSYVFSRQISIPPQTPPATPTAARLSLREYLAEVRQAPEFVRFMLQRFVFLSGAALVTPLFPLYFVREAQASDAWIGIFSTAQTLLLLVGYLLWARLSPRWGARASLLLATLGLSLYPGLTALTHDVLTLAALTGLSSLFQAALDLVLFDELMKTIPAERGPMFVALAQSLQNLSAVAAPLLGTFLAGGLGLGGALLAGAAVELAGFILFAVWKPSPTKALPA